MPNTYKELQKEKQKIEEILSKKTDECAKKGLDFDDMINETKEERNKLFSISKEMRLLQEPTVEFGKQWNGDTYTFEQFKKLCIDEDLTDNDGYGYYATETAKSNVEIIPSDITENKYRNDFTHVIWFNK